jgi:Secretion system C-terminal sorting domain
MPSGLTNAEINKITLYPNPSSGQLYLKNITSSNSFIVILNLQGEEILSKTNISNYIDISNLKNGIYIAKIIDSGKIVMTKIIKE